MKRISPRARVLAYLGALHGVFAALGFVLLAELWWALIAVEVLFLVSLLLGFRLTAALFEPLELARDSARLLEEGDFTTRFVPTGQPQVDELVHVYNRMADQLRSERVHAEERHHFLSRILEVSATGILVLDFDERVDVANPAAARLFDCEPAGLRGVALSSLPGPLGDAVAGLADGEASVATLSAGRRVRAQCGQFLDRGFRRRFFVLDELTEELRRSERAAYEKLIRTMSHEVNTTVAASGSLLQSCLAYAPQLRDDDRGDYENALGVVIDRTRALADFLGRFAALFRLPPPRLEPVDVGELLRHLARLLGGHAEGRGVAIAWELAPAPVIVDADRALLEQALANVIKNAIEAAGRGGTVTLMSGRRENRGLIEVRDTGPGLSEEVRANLFTPFFSTKEGGQGIGLTLVQEILAQHRCAFSLEAAPGGPTRFTVLF